MANPSHARHVVVILKNDPDEQPLECTLADAAELLGADPEQMREAFVQSGRFDTDRHVVIPTEIEKP